MLAGIIVQLVVMIFFSFYMAGWSWISRNEVRKAGTRMQLMLGAIAVASIAIIIRGVRLTLLNLALASRSRSSRRQSFRTAELNEGFRGELAVRFLLFFSFTYSLTLSTHSSQENEPMIILDAAPVAVAVFVLKYVACPLSLFLSSPLFRALPFPPSPPRSLDIRIHLFVTDTLLTTRSFIHPHWFLRSSPSSYSSHAADVTSQTTMTNLNSPPSFEKTKEVV
jgi:hypothetical protein